MTETTPNHADDALFDVWTRQVNMIYYWILLFNTFSILLENNYDLKHSLSRRTNAIGTRIYPMLHILKLGLTNDYV